MDKQQIKAVLFDYDGVIADTMEDNHRAWKRAFADFNVSITDDEYYLLEGMSPSDIAEKLGAQKGLSEKIIAQITGKKADYYRAHNSFRVYPEIPNILRRLKNQGIKLALVTGAARHRVEEMALKELLPSFDAVICAEDVYRPKPDKESYQKALELLRVAPEEAVIIENAPLGIQSAKAAGCFCIALVTTLPQNLLTDADKIIANHQLLEEHLFC